MANATSVAIKDANGASQTVSTMDALIAQLSAGSYASPRGTTIRTGTTLDSLLSDDFGGSAVNSTNWTVIDGGLAANPNLGNGVLAQAKIGSGIAGMTDAVSASALTVSMGTTLGAERWYLSNQSFAGKEDILVVLSKSQALAANSIFIGLVEVDPVTLVPLLNPNFAADGNGAAEFTNRGGCEFGLSATTTAYQAEAIGDSSSAKAIGVVGAATAWTTTQEALIEIDSRDITVSTRTVDNVAANGAGASRVSSQCPNDKKLYRLLMRFRNVSAPASSTSVVVQRIIVVDNYEQRVQVSSGEGDAVGVKAMAVNLTGAAAATTAIGSVVLAANANAASPSTYHHKIAAGTASDNTSVKTTSGNVYGGKIHNVAATRRFFKFFNKASAPVLGTDVPIFTIPIEPASAADLASLVGTLGLRFSTGIAYAITANAADSDTTLVTAGDVIVNLLYM